MIFKLSCETLSAVLSLSVLARSAGAAEYTICISAVRKDSSNECPGYDTKQSDGEFPVMLELWGMWSTSSLPLLTGTLSLRVVVSDGVISIGQIELN